MPSPPLFAPIIGAFYSNGLRQSNGTPSMVMVPESSARPWQPMKAVALTSSSPVGSTSSSSAAQPKNAKSPMVVTVSGRTTLLTSVQPTNAASPIMVTVSGASISVKQFGSTATSTPSSISNSGSSASSWSAVLPNLAASLATVLAVVQRAYRWHWPSGPT